MKIENIIKKLAKENREAYRWQFDNKEFWFCEGTALVDVKEGEAIDTAATYKVVISQIEKGKSHIHNIEKRKKHLSEADKLGY